MCCNVTATKKIRCICVAKQFYKREYYVIKIKEKYLEFKDKATYLIQNVAYNGTDLILLSNPKFFCEIRIEYAGL